jgi:hypothetical protein
MQGNRKAPKRTSSSTSLALAQICRATGWTEDQARREAVWNLHASLASSDPYVTAADSTPRPKR